MLGNTNEYISRIGFGCAAIGGYDYGKVNDNESIRAILVAIDSGINFFDTANVYGLGHAEEILGKALSLTKQELIIATKFGVNWDSKGNTWRDISPHRVIESVNDSLKRLKRDVIDLYQIHWPVRDTRVEDTLNALMFCKKQGKIKYIGCCNYDCSDLNEIQNILRIDSLQNSYNLLNRTIEKNILDYCKTQRISFISHSTLARGFLSGKYYEGFKFDGTDTRNESQYFSNKYINEKSELISAIKILSVKYGKTLSQVAARWILDNSLVDCSLIGLKNEKQVKEVIGMLDWKLFPEDYQSLSLLSNRFVDISLY